jgi:hypothetical protein
VQTVGKDMRWDGCNKEVGRKKNSDQHKPGCNSQPICHRRFLWVIAHPGGDPVLNSYATHNLTLTNAKGLQKKGGNEAGIVRSGI